jgi:SpoVK/Ycf46/Vps4 family AAA+-type ATPase
VITEIQTFWEREGIFRDFDLAYKRGIILWGPPGSGKSCTIQLIIEDVTKRDGIVIKFTSPGLFLSGMRSFKEIQPETPVVILMEDIDAILEMYSESSVLNILDGVDQVDKAVFLATTNYPERLGGRILNRPSRFDKRFKIGHPNKESRRLYFQHLIGDKPLTVDVERWVSDSDGFSIAHLKELFVAVCILGDDYDDAIETLSSMKEQLLSDKEFESPETMGFNAPKKRVAKRNTRGGFPD